MTNAKHEEDKDWGLNCWRVHWWLQPNLATCLRILSGTWWQHSLAKAWPYVRHNEDVAEASRACRHSRNADSKSIHMPSHTDTHREYYNPTHPHVVRCADVVCMGHR